MSCRSALPSETLSLKQQLDQEYGKIGTLLSCPGEYTLTIYIKTLKEVHALGPLNFTSRNVC